MRRMTRIIAGICAIVMLVTGTVIMPVNVKATETTDLTVCYESLKMSDYWNAGGIKAPTKEGYIFGGWFTSDDEMTYTALIEDNLTVDSVKALTNTYAKFVPYYVLNIRAQIEKVTEDVNGVGIDSTFLRIISSVDANAYQELGFDIWYNKRIEQNVTVKKLYESINNTETGGPIYPENMFGKAADFFTVLQINKIASANFKKVIYVRPYWITSDGTRVEGPSKYVRVMDGYKENGFISVPINLMAGSPVAAGTLQMTYDTRLELVDTYGFDAGMLLPKMKYSDDTNGTIRFVGNIPVGANNQLDTVNPANDIYANVWFKVKDNATVSDTEHFEFNISNLSFCDWTERMLTDVKAWDFRY